MRESFELLGRQYEGEIVAGREAVVLFRQVAAIVPKIGLMRVSHDSDAAEAVASLAGLDEATNTVRATFRGWTVDGQKITADSWPELFEVFGKYMDAYAAAIMIWKLSGFFGGSSTSKSE